MSIGTSRRSRVAIVLLVAVAFYIPRVTALDQFVTPDEARWLSRGANFFEALAHNRPIDTYQSNHPGVPTMWVGTLTFLLKYPEYPNHVRAQVPVWQEGVANVLRAQGRSPLEMLVAARALMLVAHTVLLVAVGWYACRLLGFAPALATAGLMAVDPFHLVNTRILHVDVLEGMLLVLSVLALASYSRWSGHPRDLIIGGAAGGLAIITKITALAIIPFAGLYLLLDAWRTRSEVSDERTAWIKQTAKTFAIWSASALGIVLLVWPTVWAAPRWSFQKLFLQNFAGQVGTGGNQAPDFFMGTVERNMSVLYYPVSYLWVAMPLLLGGLALALVAARRRWAPLDDARRRHVCLVLALFVLVFSVELLFGGIKGQRYLMPSHLMLLLLAGVGWVAGAIHVWQMDRPRVIRPIAVVVLGAIVLQHVVALAKAAPYYYTWDHVLFGGRRALRSVLSDGSGEGLDQAGRYLSSLPDSERMVVCSWYAHGPFSFFFRGKSTGLEARWSEEQAHRLEEADYLVAYYHQWQRKLPSEAFLRYLDRIEPERIVYIDGFEYVRIYRLRGTGIAADLRALHAEVAQARSKRQQ
jgi:hypothetical protein